MSRRLIVNVSHFTHTIYMGAPFNIIVEGRGEPHNEERPYGTYEMPVNVWQPTDVGFGQSINELILFDGKPVRRGGEMVKAPPELKESGEHHAWALITRVPTWTARGVFVADTSGPTEQEIRDATARYHATMRRAFLDGQAKWQRFKQPQMIEDVAKVAARLFREPVEWSGLLSTDGKMPCMGCGEMVPIKLAYHKVCGSVLDSEKCAELKIGPYAPQLAQVQASQAAAANAAMLKDE